VYFPLFSSPIPLVVEWSDAQLFHAQRDPLPLPPRPISHGVGQALIGETAMAGRICQHFSIFPFPSSPPALTAEIDLEKRIGVRARVALGFFFFFFFSPLFFSPGQYS